MSHRLQRIAKQIDQNLLDLNPIHQHQVAPSVEIEAELDPLLASARETERPGLFNQLRQAFDAFFAFPPRNKIAKPPNDLAGANCLFGSAIQSTFYFRSVGIGTGGKKSAGALHVIA